MKSWCDRTIHLQMDDQLVCYVNDAIVNQVKAQNLKNCEVHFCQSGYALFENEYKVAVLLAMTDF